MSKSKKSNDTSAKTNEKNEAMPVTNNQKKHFQRKAQSYYHVLNDYKKYYNKWFIASRNSEKRLG